MSARSVSFVSRGKTIFDSHLLTAHLFNRALAILLTFALLCTSTPAAPQMIVAVGKESQVSFAFWFRASGLAKFMQGQGVGTTRAQEKQIDRDARLAALKIQPGDVTLRVGQRVDFAAVGYDGRGDAVGGVKTKWSAHDDTRNSTARISQHGQFEAMAPGRFKVLAEALGQTAQVTVTVLNGRRPKASDGPTITKPVSNRDRTQSVGSSETPVRGRNTISTNNTSKPQIASLGPKESNRSRKPAKSSGSVFAHRRNAVVPTMPLPIEGGWNDGNYGSSSDPGNEIGDPPGGPIDGGAGSGNFQLATPILSLTGRGINVSLGLAYNSRLWNKSGNEITFDIDHGWPSPGWSMGFGKISFMGPNGGGMISDADGTRHNYTGQVSVYTYTYGGTSYTSASFNGHTVDGTMVDYYNSFSAVNGVYDSGNGSVRYPNGASISYGAYGQGAIYPTNITDPNGNYVTITYVNNSGPRIQTVTDSLGRLVNFHYDSNNLLTAVTAPGLNSTTRTLVRLHYRQLSLNYSNAFSGLTPVVSNSNPWVIDAIYYPSTSTGYWFGDSDSYSTFGMLAKIIEQRGISFSAASLNDQGTVTQGLLTQKQVYGYPLSPSDPGGSGLTDAPTYGSLTESWTLDGINIDSATTLYVVNETSSSRSVTVTLPNGSKSIQYSYNHPGQFDDGLVYNDETRDAAGTLLRSSSSSWEVGAYDSARPTRVQKTDDRGQTTATEFSYGPVYNQVTETRDKGYNDELIRAVRTTYENSANFTANHIFNLPLTVDTYASDNVTRVSRTEYQYDGQTLTDTPGVVMHSEQYNPFAPQIWIEGYWETEYDENGYPYYVWVPGYWTSDYNPATDYRGNITQQTKYADAAGPSGPVNETRRYDITGNMVKASSSCCEQTSLSFTSDTQYAFPQSKTRGSATDAYAQVKTSSTYDFNTSQVLSATDANGRTSQTSYDATSLRPSSIILATGGHTDYAYDDSAMSVTQTTYLPVSEGGTIADKNIKVLNGLGKVRQEQALAGASTWDFVDTAYNNMGQVSQQTRPYRSGETQQWTVITYDSLGRASRVVAPDGSFNETYFNERDFDPADGYTPTRPNVASSNAGETTLVRDAWGRERWGRTNASGNLVEVVEPNPTGNGSVATNGLITTYNYDTLGNLLTSTQDAQTRSFKYDALGRLTAQKLAEMSATLDNSGVFHSTGGTWSDVFTYDERSNLISRTDARGVKTVYNYNNDPLNRLQSISYDTTGFGDTGNPILSAATVSYGYRTKSNTADLKDVTQISSVTTTGISTESYDYDSEGRVSSKTFVLTSRSSFPFVTEYLYDGLDRCTDVRYPAEYGNGSQPRKLVHQNFDVASRLSSLNVDGQSHASNIVYNAASQTSSLNVGLSGANQITETYNYNGQTGLLDSQTVVRGGATTLLNLSYDYTNASGKRTGQLTKILNNLDHNKDRGYAYDALGRLTQATGGASGALWTQTYAYDRYGNRTAVTANGFSAKAGSVGTSQLSSEIAGVSPRANSAALLEPGVVAPTELLARNMSVALPDNLRQNDLRSISDSPPKLRSTAFPRALSNAAAPNDPPTVNLTSPLTNTTFLSWSTITLRANASDTDGTISKVEFFQGAVKLGEDTTQPYSLDWTNVPAGSYTLTARATDNAGATTSSTAVNIVVAAQAKQFVSWSAISNGTDLGNGSVRKTSTGSWDFSASATQTLLPGDAYVESTAANFNQSIAVSGVNGQERAIVIGSGGWVGIYENGVEVAGTSGHIPSETITAHGAGDRYRIEISNSTLRYIRYRAGVREIMFASAAALPAYPISAALGMSPQNAEWQKTVLAQLTRKATWSSIANGIDLGNGTVRKTSTGTWDFSAVGAQTLARGDGYFESTASYWNQSIGVTGSDSAGRALVVGTGGWAAIYENGTEVANTSPLGNISAHAAGDRYRLEIANGTLRYIRYRAGIRSVIYTSTNAVPAYPLTFSLGASFQNSEWQNTVFAQLSQTVTWSNITNGIDLGNGSVRKTSTGTWDFSASPLQQLAFGSGYFESTASYWNQSINLAGIDGAGRSLVAGTGGWAAVYENNQEVASTSPLGNLSAHAAGDRYRVELIGGKLRYVRYRGGVRSIAYTSTNPVPAPPLAFSLGASFQNSEWQNTIFSDNVPEHNDASFVSQTVPATMVPGQNYSVSVTMRNTGASTWTPDGDYQLGSENLSDNLRWGVNRVNLTTIVPPGSDATFNFTVTAPAAGSYSFQWRMVQQGVQRFGALTTNVNVQTVNNPPTVSLTSPSQNATYIAPATVPFAANAIDTDGTITKVEFFQGTVKVGEDTTSPFTFNWTNVGAGAYVLTARATDNGGAIATSSAVNITVNPPNQPPVANSGGPYSGPTGTAIQFNGGGSSDPDGLIASYQWHFGDNTTGTGATPTHAYATIGTYTVTLTVTDNNGAQASASTSATINNRPPVANTGGPYSGTTGTAVQFNGGGSSDPDGTISSYSWNFGDNTSGTGATPTHTYATAGTYTVTLTVTDNNGAHASATTTATINNRPPVANAGGPYSGTKGTAIQFNGSGSSDPDGTITGHSWNFGDNTSGTGATPSHTYATAGTYTVTLTVTDNNGAQASATATATISAVPIPRDGLASLTYGATNNHITTSGFEYDSAGNQTHVKNGDGWQHFQYDAANRLVRVKAEDNVTVIASYTYGCDNQRLVSEESGQRKYYDADRGSVLAEYTESGGSTTPAWSKTYVYLGARLLSTLVPNGSGGESIQYHHPDRLGTRVVTNAQDTAFSEQVTLPFGTALASESPGATTARFTSYDRSQWTGLDYAVNRHYDAQQGRFTQVDPAGMKATSLENPQTLNLYAYCANDPINHTDPTGLGFFSFLKKLFKVLIKVVIIVALIVAVAYVLPLAIHQIGLMMAAFAKGSILGVIGHFAAGVGLTIAAMFIGGMALGMIYSTIADVVTRCRVPNFEGLSKGRQEELTRRGVTADQWNSLPNKNRLTYFNITAAIAAAGLSLAGWKVDWAAGGIQHERVFFTAGPDASNLVGQVVNSGMFNHGTNPRSEHGDYTNSFRGGFHPSLQLSFTPDGRSLDADLDSFNPTRGPFGLLFHVTEVAGHKLGRLFGGQGTNPVAIGSRANWECK